MTHTFSPVYNKESRILILGSFPSVASRQNKFYYGNSRNRFWDVLFKVYNIGVYDDSVELKKKVLLQNKLALWDVVSQCEILGSSDNSIKNVVLNDISIILEVADIKKIILNGKTAGRLFSKNNACDNIQTKVLPSTSPANARYSFDMLYDIWKKELTE